jgi:hypothetical protein
MANESRNNLFDTIPEIPTPGGPPSEALPDHANVYVPPRELPQTSDHRTIQIKPVLLADHVDPRRAPTELRLPVLPLEPLPKEPAPWLLASSVAVVAIGSIAAAAWLGGWLPGVRAPGEVESAPPSTPLKAEDIPAAPIEKLAPAEPPGAAEPIETAKAQSPPARVVGEPNATRPEPISNPTAMPLAPGAAPRQNAARVRKKAPDPWLE